MIAWPCLVAGVCALFCNYNIGYPRLMAVLCALSCKSVTPAAAPAARIAAYPTRLNRRMIHIVERFAFTRTSRQSCTRTFAHDACRRQSRGASCGAATRTRAPTWRKRLAVCTNVGTHVEHAYPHGPRAWQYCTHRKATLI